MIRPEPELEANPNPFNDPLNDLSDEDKEDAERPEPRRVVRELERQALIKVEVRPR